MAALLELEYDGSTNLLVILKYLLVAIVNDNYHPNITIPI